MVDQASSLHIPVNTPYMGTLEEEEAYLYPLGDI